jgi:hypothetical protein
VSEGDATAKPMVRKKVMGKERSKEEKKDVWRGL